MKINKVSKIYETKKNNKKKDKSQKVNCPPVNLTEVNKEVNPPPQEIIDD